MRHAKIKKLLSEYMDGYLRPDKARMVEGHLATCPSCRETKDELEVAVKACGELPWVEMPLEVETSILEMIREEESIARRRSRLLSRLPRPAIVAAGAGVVSAIIAVVLVISLTGGGGEVALREAEKPEEKGAVTTEEASPTFPMEAPPTMGLKQNLLNLASGLGQAVGVIPQPVVAKTDNDYDQSSIRDLAEQLPVHHLVATEYTMADAINLGREFLSLILEQLPSMGEQNATLESMVKFITKEEPVALPVYAEKAKFQGKDAWIIGLAAPPRSGDSNDLSRLEIWVLNPESFSQDPNSSILFFGEHRILEE